MTSRTYMPATRLDEDLWLIDLNFQGVPGVIASYLITDPSGHTLIETGPGSTVAALEQGVETAGVRFEEITRIVVTHIHLDHAGAAGTLLRRLPQARLFVHPVGAPHMIHPEKLLRSATRIYGDRMDALWGAFEPCPADRVVIVEDDEEIHCGARTLVGIHTPGHAIHHIAWHDAERSALFTGDVAGVRLQGASLVHPPTPPPDIDIESWHESIARMRSLEPRSLELTHFGRFDDPVRHFAELDQRLDEWTTWVRHRLENGTPTDEIIRERRDQNDVDIIADTGDEALVAAYELANPSHMTVDGIARYLSWRYPRP